MKICDFGLARTKPKELDAFEMVGSLSNESELQKRQPTCILPSFFKKSRPGRNFVHHFVALHMREVWLPKRYNCTNEA